MWPLLSEGEKVTCAYVFLAQGRGLVWWSENESGTSEALLVNLAHERRERACVRTVKWGERKGVWWHWLTCVSKTYPVSCVSNFSPSNYHYSNLTVMTWCAQLCGSTPDYRIQLCGLHNPWRQQSTTSDITFVHWFYSVQSQCRATV